MKHIFPRLFKLNIAVFIFEEISNICYLMRGQMCFSYQKSIELFHSIYYTQCEQKLHLVLSYAYKLLLSIDLSGNNRFLRPK